MDLLHAEFLPLAHKPTIKLTQNVKQLIVNVQPIVSSCSNINACLAYTIGETCHKNSQGPVSKNSSGSMPMELIVLRVTDCETPQAQIAER